MRYGKYSGRGNFFSLPNEVFLLGLSAGELAVYSFLKRCENRKTHQCWPSIKTIGQAVGMSENTVRKYIRHLEERALITTEPTEVITKSNGTPNGNLLFTLRPPGGVGAGSPGSRAHPKVTPSGGKRVGDCQHRPAGEADGPGDRGAGGGEYPLLRRGFSGGRAEGNGGCKGAGAKRPLVFQPGLRPLFCREEQNKSIKMIKFTTFLLGICMIG